MASICHFVFFPPAQRLLWVYPVWVYFSVCPGGSQIIFHSLGVDIGFGFKMAGIWYVSVCVGICIFFDTFECLYIHLYIYQYIYTSVGMFIHPLVYFSFPSVSTILSTVDLLYSRAGKTTSQLHLINA